MSKNHFCILGVDPSLTKTGYALLYITEDLKIDDVKFDSFSPKKSYSLSKKLKLTKDRLENFIKFTKPGSNLGDIGSQNNIQYCGIEYPILNNHKNVKGLVNLAYMGGAIRLFLSEWYIDIVEVNPTQLKKAVTGKGNASKDQIRMMLPNLLPLSGKSFNDDEGDAIGAAYFTYLWVNKFYQLYAVLPNLQSLEEFIKSMSKRVK